MRINPLLLADGYKLDHRRQYPEGTEHIYSNFTPRSSRVEGVNEVVFFGLQYFIAEYLVRKFKEDFFAQPVDEVCKEYEDAVNAYLGPNSVGSSHVRALHALGYLPLRICALGEGTRVPLRVPMLTIENTLPEFYWLVNYIETLMSNILWLPCTSATTADRYRKILDRAANLTGGDPSFVDWQAHDFSYRGLAGTEAAMLSGAAHLLSFTGTDTIPAISFLQFYYGGKGLIGGSVPATEHSVMSCGGRESETQTFERLLNLYPTGIVSIVSDTWDLWNVIQNILGVELKDKIMAREGKLVVRPDSGDPVEILCGVSDGMAGMTPKDMGVVELLYHKFGGTTNEKGFIQLDPHVGVIYGDSITPERAQAIVNRLAAKGFASTNVVFGVGSYTYQYVTRDTYGFAMKATWAKVGGVERNLFKDPVTDNGIKKSATGRLSVQDLGGKLTLIENASHAEEQRSLLQPVWTDGKWMHATSLESIRRKLRG